ncbi:putative rRNA-processing protein EBP2 [Triangularia verruculosa]|uniref:rRNA-processing protein EBP2 n=1 Tax=Triangularia verruculosa TaxID=2587418 RepID=A0AAN7AP39_9PEZI|nr:putative rRNA-processing protein EBP2 [Triangularia verruculosa]
MAKKGAKLAAKAPMTNKQSNGVTDKKQKADRRKSNDPPVEEPVAEADEEEWEDEDSEDESDEEEGGVDFSKLEDINDSDSDSEIGSDDDDEAEDDDEESEIDVDDLDLDDMDPEEKEELAATTRVRQTINNKDALLAALKRISLLPTEPKKAATVPFAYHMTLVTSKPTQDAIPSIDDDLERELAFLNQARESALQARTLLKKENVPFTRPTDYFAETLRSDETMQAVKRKMVEAATAKKASAEARKQRDLKKFGKQVQVQKQQERAKEKRATLEKINELKRKRKDGGGAALGAREVDDMFDVAVDNELGSNKAGGKRGRSAGDHGAPNAKRQKKNEKYGFGGKKRFAKSGDAVSSGDMTGFSAKRMKHGGGAGDGKKTFSSMSAKAKGSKPRLGKDKRKAGGRR